MVERLSEFKHMKTLYYIIMFLFVTFLVVFAIIPQYSKSYDHEYTFYSDNNVGHAMVTDQIDLETDFLISVSTTNFLKLPAGTHVLVFVQYFSTDTPGTDPIKMEEIIIELNRPEVKTNYEIDVETMDIRLESLSIIITFILTQDTAFTSYHEFDLYVGWNEKYFSYQIPINYVLLTMMLLLPTIVQRFKIRNLKKDLTEEAENLKTM